MKKFGKKLLTFFCAIQVALFGATMTGCDEYKLYEETDISQYGNFYSSRWHKEVDISQYTQNIMPEKIEDFFTVVRYSYRMMHGAAFHEAYLEVVIEDETTFQSYTHQLLLDKETETFFYNNSFLECVYTDVISIDEIVDGKAYLGASEIQKVLVSDETNTLIFLSFVYPYTTDMVESWYVYYFERFEIDVLNYYNGARIRVPQTHELPYKYIIRT